jgi:hypothetical protein
MTTNWNRTGKAKALVLALLAIPNLVSPIREHPSVGLVMILMPLIFMSVALPLIVKFNAALGAEVAKPNWNDNPLTIKRPLAMFDFFAYFFVIVGLSLLIGAGIKFRTLSPSALSAISAGFGAFIGIRLTLKWSKK